MDDHSCTSQWLSPRLLSPGSVPARSSPYDENQIARLQLRGSALPGKRRSVLDLRLSTAGRPAPAAHFQSGFAGMSAEVSNVCAVWPCAGILCNCVPCGIVMAGAEVGSGAWPGAVFKRERHVTGRRNAGGRARSQSDAIARPATAVGSLCADNSRWPAAPDRRSGCRAQPKWHRETRW